MAIVWFPLFYFFRSRLVIVCTEFVSITKNGDAIHMSLSFLPLIWFRCTGRRSSRDSGMDFVWFPLSLDLHL